MADRNAEEDKRVQSPPRPAVLVVDDDPTARLTLGETLEGLGAEIVIVGSGSDALRQVLKRDFALILLDVRMPDMDGYEVATIIRQRRKSSRIPIIFLTAITPDESHIFRGYEAGAVDYVFKPLNPHVLRSKARVFIELYQQAEEIRHKMEHEKQLLKENLGIRAAMVDTERRLRSSEAREALVIEALPIALYEATPPATGPRTFINEKANQVMGFSPAEFRDSPQLWMQRIHPDDWTSVEEALARGGDYSVEYRWRCGDGSYRYFVDHGVTIPGSDEEPPRVVGAMLDQNDRRMLEEQLFHAQKMDALGQLTGGIAHDFNNMLTVVISCLDWALRQDDLSERIEKKLGSALQGALRCADLTSRLLAFSRRQQLSPVSFILNDVVRDLTEILDSTFGDGVEIDFDLAPHLWPIYADRAQMEAAVMNLIVNARDAMPNGGKVMLRTSNIADPGRAGFAGLPNEGEFVSLEVTDTGTGMSEEVLKRAVEPFFTTKEVGQGTGLGLSTTYGFVHDSGGRLLIDSKPGEGTRVRICMPRNTAPLTEAGENRISEEPCESRECTVLLVEDDVDVLHSTSRVLRDLGYRVVEATRAEDALLALQDAERVDLLFTDLMLPGHVNGHELGEQAKAKIPDLRVLYTSGYPAGACVQPEKAQPLLKKPYRDHELARAVAEVLAPSAPMQ